jgi:hypothetical protein
MQYSILLCVVLVGLVVLYRNRHGVKLQEVAIIKMAASRGEDYIERTYAGCRIRNPLVVKVKLAPLYSTTALRRKIWVQLKQFDLNVSAVRYQGVTYSF